MLSEISSETEISKAISKDLKKRGMSFVGSTIIYAFMQAVGMIDDQFVYTLLTKYKFHTPTAKRERHDQQMRDVEHMEKFLPMIGCEVPQKEMPSMHTL